MSIDQTHVEIFNGIADLGIKAGDRIVVAPFEGVDPLVSQPQERSTASAAVSAFITGLAACNNSFRPRLPLCALTAVVCWIDRNARCALLEPQGAGAVRGVDDVGAGVRLPPGRCVVRF